jgi:hypothetical protein
MMRSPWKSLTTLMKKSLADACKNAAKRLAHWHALDTLHNVLTQNPDTPIHNNNTHAQTFPWSSPVSPQLASSPARGAAAAVAASAAAAAAATALHSPAPAPAAPPLDVSASLMQKAEMLTRVNKISSELAHRAQQRLDAPTSKYTAINFFLSAIKQAMDKRKDEEWLQARLLVAMLAVGGEPAWGRGQPKANVESVGYVYQLLTIKVLPFRIMLY